MSKASKQEWDAETARLEAIRRAFWKAQTQVQQESEDGVKCLSRTDSTGQDKYWLVDRDGRILLGEHDSFFEAWVSYLGKD
jgi:hypothetical protein